MKQSNTLRWKPWEPLAAGVQKREAFLGSGDDRLRFCVCDITQATCGLGSPYTATLHVQPWPQGAETGPWPETLYDAVTDLANGPEFMVSAVEDIAAWAAQDVAAAIRQMREHAKGRKASCEHWPLTAGGGPRPEARPA